MPYISLVITKHNNQLTCFEDQRVANHNCICKTNVLVLIDKSTTCEEGDFKFLAKSGEVG